MLLPASLGCIRHTLPPPARAPAPPPDRFEHERGRDFVLEAQPPEADDYDLFVVELPGG